MKVFYGHSFFVQAEGLGLVSGAFRQSLKQNPDAVIDGVFRRHLLKNYEEFKRFCQSFDLPASEECCVEILALLKKRKPGFKVKTIDPLLEELGKRATAELKAHLYLYIPRDDAGFYHYPVGGWGEVMTAFPSTIFDIEEAGKCIACGRSTAASFHIMRVFGAGVTALGKSLNEPTLDASHNLTWDNVLRRCAKESEKEFAKMSPIWQTDKEFYAGATATLFGVKTAWRNPNAHAIGQKYTDEEAIDIYNAAKAFMRQLSKKLTSAT